MGYKIELDAAVVSIWTNEIWGKVYNKSVAEFACTHCDNLRDYWQAKVLIKNEKRQPLLI